MVKRFVKGILGIEELEKQVADFDERLHALEAEERRVQSTLKHFSNFKNRTEKELKLMGGQIEDIIASVEAIFDRRESEERIRRAKKLLARLRNNRTRIRKAQAERNL